MKIIWSTNLVVQLEMLPGIGHGLAAQVAPHLAPGLLIVQLAVVVLAELVGGDRNVTVVAEAAAAIVRSTGLASRPSPAAVAFVVTVATLQVNLLCIDGNEN